MDKELVGRFAAAVAAGAMVLSLAACESAEDMEAKPDLAATLQRTSIEKCDPQFSQMDKQNYADRLMGVLMKTDTAALRYLEENGITVCLDKRMADESYGFFENRAIGVYYPETEAGRILALQDNGNHVTDHGFLEWSASTRGPLSIEKLPHAFGGWFDKYESLGDVSAPMKAFRGSCGKSCTTTKWGGFDTVAEHPNLYQAPILAP